MKESPLAQESLKFSIEIITLYKELVNQHKEFVLSKQILRSSTSIGANVREAQNGQSKNDFIHKLCISQKECAETNYWLELLKESEYLPISRYDVLKNNCDEILRMIKSSILTAKSNQKR